MEHDFRIDVDRSIEPNLLTSSKLDLLFVDSDSGWFGGKLLFTPLSIGVEPVVNGLSGSADAEPLQQVADLRKRCRDDMKSARQPDSSGWRARFVQKRYRRGVRISEQEFFEHIHRFRRTPLVSVLDLTVPINANVLNIDINIT